MTIHHILYYLFLIIARAFFETTKNLFYAAVGCGMEVAMKQKYSLMIADMQLSVVTDAEPAQVEKVVGILDRRMREINLKSRRCSKNEAALLCALDFCADRMMLQEENVELSEKCEKFTEVFDAFKVQVEDLKNQLEHAKNENEVLRSLISHVDNDKESKIGVTEHDNNQVTVDDAATDKPTLSPAELLAQIADASGVSKSGDEQDESEDRSRVGSMFDLLSFSDF